MASPASSTRRISVPPIRLPPSSRTALHQPLCPPLRATSACPAPCGSQQCKPVCLTCWRPSGPRRDPALRRPATSCWRPSTASVNPGLKPKSPIGTPRPFCIRSGHSPGTLYLPSLLGCFRKDSARTPGSAGKRRRRSAGPRPTAFAGFVEGKADGEPAPAGLRYDQLLHHIASNNTRNELAQRGHNKQGRHNLRQVGLSYVLDQCCLN